METAPRVIGLDLSITATGIANADGEMSTVKTDDKTGDRRLLMIRDHVAAELGGLDLAMIEDLPMHAKAAGITAMAHGVVRPLLIEGGIRYGLVTPAALKMYATGKGTATKSDMRMELFKRAGLDVADDNQVDAWWLRALGLDHLGHPVLNLPQTHRRALEKIRWPKQ